MSLPWFQVCCLVVMAAAFVVLGLLLPLKKGRGGAEKTRRAPARHGRPCSAPPCSWARRPSSTAPMTSTTPSRRRSPYDLASVNNEFGFVYYFCYHFSTYKIEKPEGFDRDEAAAWETATPRRKSPRG